MKTNHRRKNPPVFKRNSKELVSKCFKEAGGPNYSYLGYTARTRHGVEGMEHDKGHRGNAKDIKETKTARKRTQRRIANDAIRNLLN
jgi:hypothetical protein